MSGVMSIWRRLFLCGAAVGAAVMVHGTLTHTLSTVSTFCAAFILGLKGLEWLLCAILGEDHS